MSDTPGREPEERLPVVRPPVEPAPVERFTSPPHTRAIELTPERAAGIVRQSSSARWVGFLGVVVVVLFVAIYWFYELAPLGGYPPRLQTEASAQQVVAIERGYNLYEANCARCHGADGEGGIGPVLNRQDKLFSHLTEDYLRNILIVGGRYACGDPNSQMPVWSDQGHPPGPLNYIQINDLIEFIRAPSSQEFIIKDHELFEPVLDPITKQVRTFHGWVDETYKPAPDATPYPDCWKDEFTASAGPSGSPAASVDPNLPTVDIAAIGIKFVPTAITAPAGEPFVINFDNQDPATPHDIQIKDSTGAVTFTGATFSGVETRQYQVPALAAGTYPFLCTVHPTMTGTLTTQ